MLAVGFDTETTGLPLHPQAKMPLQPRIIEIGCCLVDENCEVVDELSLLINPEQPLEAIITKITGITDEDLKDAPKFMDAWPQIKAIMERADILVAHNAPFDEYLLALELIRGGIPDFKWPRHTLCTVQAFMEEWGRRPKLLELYERSIGIPLAQTHRALDDVRAMMEIVKKEQLLELFKGIES
jgi:DNA polymerase III epsilon subunit-like protein